jgi:hypothetical protein
MSNERPVTAWILDRLCPSADALWDVIDRVFDSRIVQRLLYRH